jgi:hypothetical protein
MSWYWEMNGDGKIKKAKANNIICFGFFNLILLISYKAGIIEISYVVRPVLVLSTT